MQDSEDADELYGAAATTLGTSTKATIVEGYRNLKLHIDSELIVRYEALARFYRARTCGVPCMLRFPRQPTLSEHEYHVYLSIVNERKRHLVKVELLTFDNMPVRHANQRSALKMAWYVTTLSSCARGPGLADLFSTGAQ